MFDRYLMTLLPSAPQKNIKCWTRLSLISLSLAVLSACQSTIPDKPSITPSVADTPTIRTKPNPRVTALLDDAYRAFEEDRLTTPIEDNAYLKFLQVLSIEPLNGTANQGISEIVEKYLAWAILAVERKNYTKALSYVTKANSVDENHLNIKPVEKMIRGRQLASHKVFGIDRQALQKRSTAVIEQLQSIAIQIEYHQAAIVISAPTDGEGRWIYQQLNYATENRIRATFELSSQPEVRISYQ